MKKRFLSLLLALTLLGTLLPTASLAAGSSMDDATPISFGETVEGEVTKENTVDFYEVTLPSPGIFSIDLDAEVSAISYNICDSAGKTVSNGGSSWYSTVSANSNSGHATVESSKLLTAGTYYVKISQYSGYGPYSFSTDFEAMEETFPDTGSDNTTGSANKIEFGKTYKGLLPFNLGNDNDFYEVTLPFPGILSIDLDAEVSAISYYICDSAGKTVSSGGSSWGSTVSANSNSGHATVKSSKLLTAGTYYVKISQYSGYGPYSFSVDFGEPEPETVKVTLKDNNGNKDRVLEIEKGKAISAPAEPSREGYTFDGWYTDSGCTKAWSFSTAVSADMTLYAKWTVNAPTMVTVTLKDNNGGKDRALEVEKGKAVSAPAEPSREGYTFDGWYTDSNCTKAWSFKTAVEKDMTLYAKWTAVAPGSVTVTLKTGTGDKTLEVEKGKPMTVPTNPSREGYTFGGWYSDEKCSKAWNFNTAVEKDMILYAQWTAVSSSATTTGKSSQSISVDGQKVTLDAYTLAADSNGGDVTYVKLRDVAEVLNGTQAQFNVEWLNGAIYVASKSPYTTKNGTELQSITLRDSSFQWNTAPILFGGVTMPLEGIVLTDVNNGGHTFFKLRDLGNALGFKVDWSAEKGIYIETK